MNVRLVNDKAKADNHRAWCQGNKWQWDLQMLKWSFKTTLGDLQGDQSKVQLSKSPSFIVGQRDIRSTEFCMAVHNYDVVYIKGECRSAPWTFGVPCGYEWRDDYKDVSKPRTTIMEPSFIWGYVSFGLVLLALLGLIGFTWWALRKIRGRPVL
jgi:hypothetical protein